MSRVIALLYLAIKKLRVALVDVLPIIIVIGFFQVAVIQQPIPEFGSIIVGSIFVVVGLMLFVEGLNIGLFPIGETMANSLTRRGSLFWLLTFAFALGFSTTVAEPALIAVAAEAGRIAAEGGLIQGDSSSIDRYALGMRLTVAFSVGFAILIGVLRILLGWPIYYLIIGGYICVIAVTFFAPDEIIGIAYDVGGVTTSTITVPLVTALGVGLAKTIKGRKPLTEGFGLIAFASLTPMIFVMIYGLIYFS
ncbi:MAG: DUF1538 domain-containing protein [Saprospirales bacterium]|nr:MAG: DUF1538 domain-containing protein [Saprospirales bacterium]